MGWCVPSDFSPFHPSTHLKRPFCVSKTVGSRQPQRHPHFMVMCLSTGAHWHTHAPRLLACVAPQVWTLLVSTARTSAEAKRSTDGVHDDTPKEAYPVLMERDSPHEKLIVRDIARTYPGNAFFQDGVGQETLLRVIKAYANYDIEVGYCQGSPFIVGALLLHVPEEDAFDLFVTMMREYKLRGLFRPSMADLPLRLFQFNQLFSQIFPELYAHFEDISVPVSSFASQWFLSMFGTVLPLEAVFRILDLFLLDTGSPTGNFGMLVIFRVGLAILGGNYDYLLMANFESIMAFMSPKDLAQRCAAGLLVTPSGDVRGHNLNSQRSQSGTKTASTTSSRQAASTIRP